MHEIVRQSLLVKTARTVQIKKHKFRLKCALFFRTIEGLLRYVAVRYGGLEISDKY
jgi:hypothetical protein